MMNRPLPLSREEQALFLAVARGTVSEEDFKALEQRLTEDAELRMRYVRFMDMEANLHNELGAPLPAVCGLSSRRWGRTFLERLAVGVACLVVGAFSVLVLQPAAPPAVVAPPAQELAEHVPPVEEIREDSVLMPGPPLTLERSGFEVSDQGIPDAVAILTFLELADRSDSLGNLKQGDQLRPGLLILPEGTAQIDFLNGAQVVISGPAQMRIHSQTLVTLQAGSAAARVPYTARGFVMNAPDAAIVDLGTEFSVRVNENGESDIEVTDGEVVVSLLGEDGNTLFSERVGEAGGVSVKPTQSTLSRRAPTGESGLRVSQLPVPPLKVTDQYVETVKQDGPFAYWRFNEMVDRRVPNEMGERHTLVLHAVENDYSVTVQNGLALLRESPTPRHLSVDEGLPGWNSASFSIELWACPQRLSWQTLVDVLSEDWEGDLNAIEIALQTPFIHAPGALRFFHRHPPAQSIYSGVNLFGHETCVPNKWLHIVAVKTPDFISMTVNGKEVRKVQAPMECDDGLYQLSIGQMDQRLHRQFDGALDEIALYRRELTPEEIQRHYQLLTPGDQD